MQMCVNAAGSNNVTFASDHFGSRSDNDVDIGLHIGVACFAYAGNTAVLDGDISLYNSPVNENKRIISTAPWLRERCD